MTTARFTTIMAVFTLSGAAPMPLQSAIITHFGAADPTSEGWATSSAGPAVSTSGGLDGTTAQWTIDTGTASRKDYSFGLTDPQIGGSFGWIATARLKAVSNSDAIPNDIILEVDDSESRWQVSFVTAGPAGSPGLFFDTLSGPTLITSIPDIGTAYHTYDMRLFRGSAGGLSNPNLNTDDVVQVSLDGSLVGTLGRTSALATSLVSGGTIRWGDGATGVPGTVAGPAESRWNSVQFSVVPEPSTVAIWSLLGAAAGVGAWRRRRKR